MERLNQALERVYLGRGSILYYLLAQDIQGIYFMWDSHFSNGKKTYDPNIGSSYFSISNEQQQELINYQNQLDPLTSIPF